MSRLEYEDIIIRDRADHPPLALFPFPERTMSAVVRLCDVPEIEKPLTVIEFFQWGDGNPRILKPLIAYSLGHMFEKIDWEKERLAEEEKEVREAELEILKRGLAPGIEHRKKTIDWLEALAVEMGVTGLIDVKARTSSLRYPLPVLPAHVFPEGFKDAVADGVIEVRVAVPKPYAPRPSARTSYIPRNAF